MCWHYRIFKVIPKEGETYFCLKEFYKIGKKTGWTENPIDVIAESKKSLIQALEWMLKDAKKYPVKTEKL